MNGSDRESRDDAFASEQMIADCMSSGRFKNEREVIDIALRRLLDAPKYGAFGDHNAAKTSGDFSSNFQFAAIAAALPMLVAQVDCQARYLSSNRSYQEWFGVRPDEMLGLHIRDIVGAAAYEGRREYVERALLGEQVTFEANITHTDGSERRCETHYIPNRPQANHSDGFFIIVLDLEERAAYRNVLVAERRFRTAIDAVEGVLWTNSPDGQMVGKQPGWEALTGQKYEEYEGFGWSDAVHPDDAASSKETWHAAVAAKKPYVHEHRVRDRTGAWRAFSIRALPILDADGQIAEWVGVHTDITDQREAEFAKLRELNEQLEARVILEIEERRNAEQKLAHAQRMETIGELTGGIAHDFNNLLQVILGNLQLLGPDVRHSVRAQNRLAHAQLGVERGAKLAAQLLAFGRRQVLEPKVINPARMLAAMHDMVRRVIGEAIEVETVASDDQWNAFVDQGQLENAVLNLAINARDAMDGKGKLTIEAANIVFDESYASSDDDVAPGQYVMIAVSDNGCGMTPEIKAKVFEPFFSTKAEGRGSGLGLSMVYGFTKQSGGQIKIYTEPGQGTAVRLYLPRAVAPEDVIAPKHVGPATGGDETILVVEDDEQVRSVAIALLTDLGYRVLKAADATRALAVIDSGVAIDVLFTDTIMPGPLDTRELARRACEQLPDLAVLYTSGFTATSIVHDGRLASDVELLSKPYSRDDLARKVRHVLDSAAARVEVGSVDASFDNELADQ